ncbi:MAG: hypothetical protein ACRER1_08255 [Gammaproteobacteria bacterium]
MRHFVIVLALAVFLVACVQPGSSHARGDTAASGATAAQIASSYSSPFAYCRAIGTMDKPGARYTGAEPPPAVIAGLVKAFGAPANAAESPMFQHGTFWRCMDGAVYACNVGANLPCESKANTDRAPTEGERQFCGENHDSLIIPMYVTGHDTIYDWRCKGNVPVAGKTLSKVDKRGYIANIWYRILPPDKTAS